jgi:hypothetical protein
MSGDRDDERGPVSENNEERGPVSENGSQGIALSRRQVLVGGGAAAATVAAAWYGPAVVGDGFQRHVARVLGISTELAHALTERAREGLTGGRYEVQALEFLAATKLPGSELPGEIREAAVRDLLEAMLDTAERKAAYAGLIRPADIGSRCRALGPI